MSITRPTRRRYLAATPLTVDPKNDRRAALLGIKQCIYFVRTQDMIKIGHTVDPRNRLTHYPDFEWTNLLAIIPGTRADERAMHERFAHLLVRGREYFEPAPEIFDLINEIRERAGVEPITA